MWILVGMLSLLLLGIGLLVLALALSYVAPVVEPVAGGEHEHWQARALGAKPSQQVEPGAVGQHEVQHHRLEPLAEQGVAGIVAAGHRLGRKARQPQPGLKTVAEQGIILDDQYAHGPRSRGKVGGLRDRRARTMTSTGRRRLIA